MGYKIFRAIIKPLFCLIFGVRYAGRENLSDCTSGFLAISNHISGLDAIAVHCVAKDKIRLMAKAELFENKALKWLITLLGAFPVNRGMGDTSAIRTALSLLKEGHTVGLFPEGTRSKTGKMGEFLAGAAMIAQKADTPIVPIRISGNYKPFRKTMVYIGKPYMLSEVIDPSLPKRDKLTEATKYMQKSVAELGNK